MKNICIVGGGTAGYVAALILKARFKAKLNITIIKSNKIGIIGVGEGSTEHWKDFLYFVDINPFEIIKNCDATCKSGIMFENWSDKPFLHSVTNQLNILKLGQTLLGYQELIVNNCQQKELNNINCWKNNIEKFYINSDYIKNKITPSNQFHFNTFKLNEFLNKKCIERNITIIDDEIENVFLNEKGEIKELKGIKNNYNFNFYIDSTGFKKLLISKMGAKWQSYKKYLKMKEAIAFPTEDTENYNIYTTAKAMDYGWMFQIPTYGRQGNGYIFDSDYINAEQAKYEVEKLLNKKIDIAKHIKFDPGCIDTPWINNCVAIGLSANFVEPLEATSIGTSIQQVFLLMHLLPNYDKKTIDDYNYKVEKIMENIRDFIVLHYITKKENTIFWKDVKKIKIPDSLKDKLEKWKNRMPIREDFSNTNYLLFFESNWTHVLYGLGLIDTKKIKTNHNFISEDNLLWCKKSLIDFKNECNVETIKHKEYLDYIRNLK
jgi:tryptophan halogenase